MDSLNTATFNCLNDKRENLIAQKNTLVQKYENTYSIMERMNLQDKISKLTAKIDKLDTKMEHYQKNGDRFEKAVPSTEFSEIQFGKHDFDAVMVSTMDEISTRAETGNFSIPEMAESAVTVAINTQEMSRSDLEMFKTYIPDNYLENAEMILEDDGYDWRYSRFRCYWCRQHKCFHHNSLHGSQICYLPYWCWCRCMGRCQSSGRLRER